MAFLLHAHSYIHLLYVFSMKDILPGNCQPKKKRKYSKLIAILNKFIGPWPYLIINPIPLRLSFATWHAVTLAKKKKKFLIIGLSVSRWPSCKIFVVWLGIDYILCGYVIFLKTNCLNCAHLIFTLTFIVMLSIYASKICIDILLCITWVFDYTWWWLTTQCIF